MSDNRRMPGAEQVVSLLREARGYIARGWTKGPYAVNSNGWEVQVESSEAVAWCSRGALMKATFNKATSYDYLHAAHELLGQARPPGYGSYIDYNESNKSDQASVLAMFDRAIALAEAKVAKVLEAA